MNRGLFAYLAAASGLYVLENHSDVGRSATEREIVPPRKTEEYLEQERQWARKQLDEQESIRAKYRAERAARKAAAFAKRQPRNERNVVSSLPNVKDHRDGAWDFAKHQKLTTPSPVHRLVGPM